MGHGVDPEIRDDFLIEAGELLAQLGEQLVALERTPDDRDQLNAVFRAFHTIKGGAGFLQLGALVQLCHAAEDVFGRVRAGERRIDGGLMDSAQQALDCLQEMLAQVAAGSDPTPAPAALIGALHAAAGIAEPVPAAKPALTLDEEFEAELDRLQRGGLAASVRTPAATPVPADLIDDDEFEELLDQLHGGAAPGSVKPAELPPAAVKPTAPVAVPASAAAAPVADTSVRVDTRRLDQLMDLVGELVLVRNRFRALRAAAVPPEAYARSIGELDQLTRGLQLAVTQTRMQPIRKVFSRFPKLARDVARSLGKQVEVELSGEDTDLDKNLVEALADPLVHMVRNSVDHGIELPDQRQAAGKSPVGQLRLRARQEGDQILITVEDDGAGIDPERLRRKCIERGLITEAAAARLTPDECLQLVFLPGFSTKDQVSDLSGRGVGMDVVKSRIAALNGQVVIESVVGRGSTVKLRVPLTLAIIPALMVTVGPRRMALPETEVRDVFALDRGTPPSPGTAETVAYREERLRLIDLGRWIGEAPSAIDGSRHVVVTEVAGERYGFVVDQVRDREDIVVKPLGVGLRGLAGLAGATVTGEGRVALILDLPGLVSAWHSGRFG